VGPTPEIIEFLEAWHDFFLLAGTAAVTLVGLLFVALSLNLDVLIHDTKAHLLQHARSTLLSFTYVLFVSLIALVPLQGLRLISINLFMLSAISLGVHLFGVFRARRQVTSAEENFMRRRGRILVIGYLIGIGIGVGLFMTHEREWMYGMVGLTCMVLGNAAGSSWDLLVRVGKLKANAGNSATSSMPEA